MSFLYELIGRLVVFVVRRRFGRQIQIAAGATVVAAAGVTVGVIYLLASRDVEEG